MNSATSIFYVNSMGFMCQWKGQIIGKTETTVSIRFSKNKAFKYNLLEGGFLLVTKKPVKKLGVCISENAVSVSFDEDLKKEVLSKTAGNVEMVFDGREWL